MALNIRAAMRKYGIQQKEVASRLGMTPTGLSLHINGNPTVNVLQKIADAIGCDIVELFDSETKNGAVRLTCPHCKHPLLITIKEDNERLQYLHEILGDTPIDERTAKAFYDNEQSK